MRKKITNIVKLLLIVGVLSTPGNLKAQGNPGDFPGDVDDVPVPFDGGVSLLVIAGIGYGLKKVRYERNNQNSEKI